MSKVSGTRKGAFQTALWSTAEKHGGLESAAPWLCFRPSCSGQRFDGIEASRPTGGEIAGEERNSREQNRDPKERHRIGGADAKEETRQQTSQCERAT